MELSRAGADLLGESQAAVLLTLARLTRGVSGREIARLSGMATHSTARRVLRELARIGLVTIEETPNVSLYSLNRNHVFWPPVFEILSAPAIVEERISGVVSGTAGSEVSAVIFGSFARGDSSAESDVDLALVFPDSVPGLEKDRVADEIDAKIRELTGNPAQILALDRTTFRAMAKAKDPLTASWAQEARRISGPELDEVLAGRS